MEKISMLDHKIKMLIYDNLLMILKTRKLFKNFINTHLIRKNGYNHEKRYLNLSILSYFINIIIKINKSYLVNIALKEEL
jgi:hypothetical protein